MDEIRTKGRIEYIDAMRGFVMLLVVYWHISLYTGVSECCGTNWFLPFFMPLFFFISGFFSSLVTPPYLLKNLKKKVKFILLPSLIMGGLFIYVTHRDLLSSLLNQMKDGYWFTIVLFEMYLLYSFLSCLIYRYAPKTRLFILLSVVFILHLLSIIAHRFDENIMWNLFSGFQLVRFMPYFILGVIFRMYEPQVMTFIRKGWVMSLFIIVYSIFVIHYHKIGLVLQGYLGIAILYVLFQSNESLFSSKHYIGRGLIYVGIRTLPIYLFHYFVLQGISSLSFYLSKMVEGNSFLMAIIIVGVMTFIVTGCCLIVEWGCRVAPPLYQCLFGEIKK